MNSWFSQYIQPIFPHRVGGNLQIIFSFVTIQDFCCFYCQPFHVIPLFPTSFFWKWHFKWTVFCYSLTTVFPHQRGHCLWTFFVSILFFSCGHCMFLLCISHLFTSAGMLCGWLKGDFSLKDSTMASESLRFTDFVGSIFHILCLIGPFQFLLNVTLTAILKGRD